MQMLRARLGVAPQLPGDVATGLVRQGLEAIDPVLVERMPELLQALSLDPADGSGRCAPERTIEALRDVLVKIARRQPQVLFLYDWQWSDDATRRLTHALCASSNFPMLILAASRPPEVGDVALTHVEALISVLHCTPSRRCSRVPGGPMQPILETSFLRATSGVVCREDAQAEGFGHVGVRLA